jgi:hypothetical protein
VIELKRWWVHQEGDNGRDTEIAHICLRDCSCYEREERLMQCNDRQIDKAAAIREGPQICVSASSSEPQQPTLRTTRRPRDRRIGSIALHRPHGNGLNPTKFAVSPGL